MSEAVLLVGTRKGLWIGRSDGDRAGWEWDEPQFLMDAVYSVCVDDRGDSPRLFAGATSEHWGPQVFRSDDLGRSWTETPNGAIRFPEGTDTSLERVWQIQPAGADDPEVVYAGSEPSALFRSTDRGESFELVRPLWDHPHRKEWGAGYGGQAIHTIVPHPTDSQRLTVAMSTGGVYRTADGRESWAPANAGIKAYFLPDPWPEFGQCVHKVAAHPDYPDRLFAQNHHGVYRSDDGGGSWTSIADGLPSRLRVQHRRPPGPARHRVRFPAGRRQRARTARRQGRVWRSDDAGGSWRGWRRAAGRVLGRGDARRDVHRPGRPGGGLLRRPRGSCSPAATRASLAAVGAHLPDVLSVRAAVLG